ncbi:hypothetical protein Vadar_012715 [Vaccinium darrowii]|uniref:Uncharacterized protein n=1 Tax=Vaccinium darrowii TaxID=229202 RepID=A0ACB7Y6I8_9ERIC|nr:hypothetical protein Vadar_012715 [Vaccinium darrowii]
MSSRSSSNATTFLWGKIQELRSLNWCPLWTIPKLILRGCETFCLEGGALLRMANRNVTIVTATLNTDAPFSEFIAARGLFPLYSSMDRRFPFYNNVFDLVHCGSGLDVGGRLEKLEFLMFDIDQILRVRRSWSS